MFTDFTVEHVYGYDRSIDPQPLKQEVKFSDYVGKGTYVLVDFWSPWCGPCRREIPNIQQVYEQYKDKGLQVLSLAVWERKPQSHTIETAAELGMDWLHINNCGQIPTDIYGVEGIPHIILFAPDGTILKRNLRGEAMMNEVDKVPATGDNTNIWGLLCMLFVSGAVLLFLEKKKYMRSPKKSYPHYSQGSGAMLLSLGLDLPTKPLEDLS